MKKLVGIIFLVLSNLSSNDWNKTIVLQPEEVVLPGCIVKKMKVSPTLPLTTVVNISQKTDGLSQKPKEVAPCQLAVILTMLSCGTPEGLACWGCLLSIF